MRAAAAWSSQNPGAPIASSSSTRRVARRSGSKVITDPGELGPDLLQALVERLAVGVRHAPSVPGRCRLGRTAHGRRPSPRSASPGTGRTRSTAALEVEPAGRTLLLVEPGQIERSRPVPETSEDVVLGLERSVAGAGRHASQVLEEVVHLDLDLVDELLPCRMRTRRIGVVAVTRRPDAPRERRVPAPNRGSRGRRLLADLSSLSRRQWDGAQHLVGHRARRLARRRLGYRRLCSRRRLLGGRKLRTLVPAAAASGNRDGERDPDEPPARRSHARTIGHDALDEHPLPTRGENPAA